MDLSSLEICQRGIRTLPNTNTVADLQTTVLAQEPLCDSPWLMFCRKLQGMTTETLFAPRAISLTHPVSKQARHAETALLDATNSSSLAQPPSQFFTLFSILLLMPPAIFFFLVSLPPPLLLWTRSSIDFLPTPPIASSAVHFFLPKSIFQCNSHTVLFLASSSSCLLYLSESHDV